MVSVSHLPVTKVCSRKSCKVTKGSLLAAEAEKCEKSRGWCNLFAVLHTWLGRWGVLGVS